MSPLAYALRSRFEDVCSRELSRHRRKIASLSPTVRADVEAMAVEITRAISAYIESTVDRHGDDHLDDVVRRVFITLPGGKR